MPSFGSMARTAAAAEYGRRNVNRYARHERLKWLVPLGAVLLVAGAGPTARGGQSLWGVVSDWLVPVLVVLAVVGALFVLARSGLGKGYRNRW